jgi:hypothetical protein
LRQLLAALTTASAVERAKSESGCDARALRKVEMNQNPIVAALVRGAAWQLMRRTPTWILILVLSAGWLFASRR